MPAMRNCLFALLSLSLLSCNSDPSNVTTMTRSASASYPVKPVPVKPFDFQPDMVLLVTGGTNGRLEPCNCTGVMPGGLTRRGGMLASYRAAFSNCLTLDTGDMFWIAPDPVRHSFLLRGSRMLGYDAVALGDQEWITPPDQLKRLLEQTGGLSLSTTVRFRDGMVKPAEQIIRKTPTAPVAVISYAPEDAFLFTPKQTLAGLDVLGEDALARQVEQLKSQGNVVVVIVHGSEQAARQCAQAVPGIDAIIRGHATASGESAERVGNVPIMKIGGPETVGVFAMKCDGGKLTASQWRVEVLDDRWPADLRMRELYQAYAHTAMDQALSAARKGGLDYQSSETCGQCHSSQYNSWQRTAHARAYKTLTDARRAGDPDCLMCHTSGFGTERGFTTISQTPPLANVNCQDCHRFNMSDHVDASRGRIATFQVPPANEDLCRTCHTNSNSPLFEYSNYRAKIVSRDHGSRG